MNAYRSILVTAVIAAFSGPFASFAADENKGMTGVMDHGGQIGTIDHNTAKSTKSRDQVKKELDAAHKDGSHEMGNEASTVQPKTTGPSKTRDQVKKELDAAHKGGTHDHGGEANVKSKQ